MGRGRPGEALALPCPAQPPPPLLVPQDQDVVYARLRADFLQQCATAEAVFASKWRAHFPPYEELLLRAPAPPPSHAVRAPRAAGAAGPLPLPPAPMEPALLPYADLQ